MEVKYRRDLWREVPCLIVGNRMITNHAAGNAAEIGVAEGNFSEDILRWPINIPVLYMVDRWRRDAHTKGDSNNPQEWHDKNYKQVLERFSKYHERAQVLRGESIEMALHIPDGSLAFVNVDADHSFTGVTNDILAWAPKLIRGGVMAFHDYENPQYGVKKAFCAFRKLQINLLPEDKPEDAGAWFRWVC